MPKKSIKQQVIDLAKANPDLIDEQDVKYIIEGNAIFVYKNLEQEFKGGKFDVNVLKKKQDQADAFYEKAKGIMSNGKQAQKRFNDYRTTLGNIFYSKSMKPKFTDTDGILKNTYVGLNKKDQDEIQKKYKDQVASKIKAGAEQLKKKIEKASGSKPEDIQGFESELEKGEASSSDTSQIYASTASVAPPPPPSLMGQDTPAIKAFNNFMTNQIGGYELFKNSLQAGKTKRASIVKLIQAFRKNYTQYPKITYSKKKKAQLIDEVLELSKQIAKDYKLDRILEEIEQPAKIQKITEEAEELQEAIGIAKEQDIPISDVLDLTKEQEQIYKKVTEAELQGEVFDVDEYIRNKFQIPNDERITNFLVQYDDREQRVHYKKSPIQPENYSKKSIRDTLDKILLNNVYIDRIGFAIGDRKDDRSFRELSQQMKADSINKNINHKIVPDDIRRTLNDPEVSGLFRNISGIVFGTPRDNTIENYYDTVEEIRKLKMSTDKNKLAQIAGQIVKYIPIYNEKEDDLLKFIDQEVNAPADVRILPEGVKIKQVAPEELESDLQKYNKILKDISIKEKKPFAERTPEDSAEIDRLKEELKKYSEGAKKEAAQKASRDAKSSQAVRRKGALRPHMKNPTEQAVEHELNKPAEEQIKDIRNWYIFDLPSDFTGVGNDNENPLVKQNSNREWAMVSGTDKFTNLVPYLLDEGVDERKDFAGQHSQLNQKGINIGLQNHKWEENEAQFLERFNSGNNGLFSQDQTKEEVSDFQPIYQKPNRYINGGDYPFDNVANAGITNNDKAWLDNLNLFYKGADIN